MSYCPRFELRHFKFYSYEIHILIFCPFRLRIPPFMSTHLSPLQLIPLDFVVAKQHTASRPHCLYTAHILHYKDLRLHLSKYQSPVFTIYLKNHYPTLYNTLSLQFSTKRELQETSKPITLALTDTTRVLSLASVFAMTVRLISLISVDIVLVANF